MDTLREGNPPFGVRPHGVIKHCGTKVYSYNGQPVWKKATQTLFIPTFLLFFISMYYALTCFPNYAVNNLGSGLSFLYLQYQARSLKVMGTSQCLNGNQNQKFENKKTNV